MTKEQKDEIKKLKFRIRNLQRSVDEQKRARVISDCALQLEIADKTNYLYEDVQKEYESWRVTKRRKEAEEKLLKEGQIE